MTASTMSATQPYWAATTAMPTPPALTGKVSADVCVVGAGIAGMATAYLLSQAGRRVVVLDDGPIGGGQTTCTTAHLASAIDDRFCEIERIHGVPAARLAAESHAEAIDQIERIVVQEEIDCGFARLDGYLFCPPDKPVEFLDREFDAAVRAGADVSRMVRAPLRGFDTGPCLRFARQGQFHPLQFLTGLVAAIDRQGGELFGNSHAERIEGGPDAHVGVRGGGEVRANAIVVATNTPVNDRIAIHTKQAPYMTYVVGLRVAAGSTPRALYWDTADPYHYVRLQPLDDGDELLIVGGEDHKTGQADDAEDRFARLEGWARARFPVSGDVEYHWSGQVMETIDGLAFIGRNPLDHDNVFIATGDSGMGMTHGVIAGMLLTDLILGRANPWKELYEPSRKPLAALPEFALENLNVAAQYAALLTPGEVESVDEIARGEGAILRRGIHKVAAYRDEQGVVTECSAVCPHLGCVVAFNHAEKTWDCRCHGSRFRADGTVINGPANGNLSSVTG